MHASHWLLPSLCGGHSGGRTQQMPGAIGEQCPGPFPPSCAQYDSAGHAAFMGPPQLKVVHGPAVSDSTLESCRRQWLKYVVPSHPHTGISVFGHSGGKGVHVPDGLPHAALSQ